MFVLHHHFNIENMLHQMCYVAPRSVWKCWDGWAGENVICDRQRLPSSVGHNYKTWRMEWLDPDPGHKAGTIDMFGRVEGGGMRLAAGGRLQLRKPPKCAECERGLEGGPLTGAGWGCQPSALPPPYCDKICTITPTLHVTILS